VGRGGKRNSPKAKKNLWGKKKKPQWVGVGPKKKKIFGEGKGFFGGGKTP